jgi:hypothetical protein
MPFLKGYFKPKDKKEDAAPNAPATVMQQIDLTQPPAPWAPHHQTPSSDVLSTRPVSVFPDGDFRNQSPEYINDVKCEVMVNWLHSKQEEKMWTGGGSGEGVVLKKSKGRYVCCPAELQQDGSDFYQAIAQLNVRVRTSITPTALPLLMTRRLP